MTRAANSGRISGTKNIPVSTILIQPRACLPWRKWWCCPEGSPWLAQAEWWRRAHVLVGCMGNVGVTEVCVADCLWKPERGKGSIDLAASSYQQQVPGPQGDQIDWKEEWERERKRISSSCSTPKSVSYRLNGVVIFRGGTVQDQSDGFTKQ